MNSGRNEGTTPRHATPRQRREWQIRRDAELTRFDPVMWRGFPRIFLFLSLVVLLPLAVVSVAGICSQWSALSHWIRVDGRVVDADSVDPRTGRARTGCVEFDYAGVTYTLTPTIEQCPSISDTVAIVMPPNAPEQAHIATFYGALGPMFLFAVVFNVGAAIALTQCFGALIFRAMHPSLAPPR